MSQDFDLDRLADYGAGLLDTADADAVSRLVDTDATWASAHAALAAADTSVRNALREAARSRLDPMPADVIARLEEALAGQRPLATTPTVGRRKRSSAPPAGLRRRFTVGLAAAAAAVAVIVGGLGVITQLIAPGTSEQAATRDNGASDAGAPVPAIAPPAGEDAGIAGTAGPAFVSSGTDYGPTTLARLALTATAMGPAPPQLSAPAVPELGPGASKAPALPAAVRASVSGPLARLTDPAALAACLAAVARSHPGTPAVVDYARYEGSPALLVLVRTVTSAAVVVVGPDCGLADVDEVAFATIS